jgi:hypothetical protein
VSLAKLGGGSAALGALLGALVAGSAALGLAGGATGSLDLLSAHIVAGTLVIILAFYCASFVSQQACARGRRWGGRSGGFAGCSPRRRRPQQGGLAGRTRRPAHSPT